MIFNKHLNFEGSHAFLGASKYHWVNYDDEKVALSYLRFLAVRKGTELHDFAERCINLRQRLPRSKKTLNSYVNDAIGFRMIPEQGLEFTNNCYGTADSISFNNKILSLFNTESRGDTGNKSGIYDDNFLPGCLSWDGVAGHHFTSSSSSISSAKRRACST